MITLPAYWARRAWLRSFWLAVSLVGGLFTGALLACLASPRWVAMGGVAAVVLAVPGLLWPRLVSLPYRVWNKLAREFARYAGLWLMAICFYIIFVAVGRVGSSLALLPSPTGSLWTAREAQEREGWQGIRPEESLRKGWIAAFISWAARSGNWWACCLLPFLMMLAAFESEPETNGLPTSIYTLF